MATPTGKAAAARQLATGYALRDLPRTEGLTPLPGTSTIGPEPESPELRARLAALRADGYSTISPVALLALEQCGLDHRTLPPHLRRPANAEWFDAVQAYAEGWDLT